MKKTILKTVVATAVVAATMAISSVATWAADADNTTTWDFSKASTDWSTDTNADSDGNYVMNYKKEASGLLTPSKNSTQPKYESGDLNLKSGGQIYMPLNDSTKGIILHAVYTSNDNKRPFEVGSSSYILRNKEKNALVKIYDITGLPQELQDGKNYILITSTGDCKITSFTLEEYNDVIPTYSVSGTVSVADGTTADQAAGKTFTVSNEEDSADATINEDGTTFTVNNRLPSGTYNFSVDNNFYTVSGEVTISSSDVKDAVVTVDVYKTHKVSGTTTDVAEPGDKIALMNGTSVIATATVNDSGYSVNVPSGTYTIGIDSKTYSQSTKEIDEVSVTVTNNDVTFDLTASDMKVWDFTNGKWYSSNTGAYKVEGKAPTSGTIKGLNITATNSSSNGKFDATNRDSEQGGAQAKNITITVPVEDGYKAVYTTKDGVLHDDAVTNGTTSTITVGSSDIYIKKIETIEIGKFVDAVYEGSKGIVAVKDNKVYAIGKVTNITIANESDKTATLTVGNAKIENQNVVYESVVIGGETVAPTKSKTYYLGVEVTDVPGNAEAEEIAGKVSLDLV